MSISIISPLFIFLFVDGTALVKSIEKFIKFMIQLDSKYVPFIIAIILSFIIFLILTYNRKKSKREEVSKLLIALQKEDFEWLITFFKKSEEIFYMQINDLISKFKTYTIGNNDEHEKIIKSFNEAIKGTVDNLQKGDYTPKEAIAEIGKDERVKIAFDENKKHIEREREKLKELFNKWKKNESN